MNGKFVRKEEGAQRHRRMMAMRPWQRTSERLIHLQASEPQGLPRNARHRGEARKDPFRKPSEGVRSVDTFISDIWSVEL